MLNLQTKITKKIFLLTNCIKCDIIYAICISVTIYHKNSSITSIIDYLTKKFVLHNEMYTASITEKLFCLS